MQSVLERSDLLSQMQKIADKWGVESEVISDIGGFTNDIVSMYNVVYGLSYVPGEAPFQTVPVLKRQVVCYINCIHCIFDRFFARAFWEMYDFLDAGKENDLNGSEMLILMTILRFFMDELAGYGGTKGP